MLNLFLLLSLQWFSLTAFVSFHVEFSPPPLQGCANQHIRVLL